MLKKRLDKLIPPYARIPLAAVVIINFLVYYGARLIAENKTHFYMETWLDRKIPFLPWTVFIYYGCYLFWIANYILSGHLGKPHALHFYSSEIIAKLICFLFFIFLPTSIVRPEVTGTGIADKIIAMLYKIDAANNLFPSIHCLVSWFCYIGVRGQERIPKWYQRLSCFLAILVFISTLTTKQHVIADVISGMLLAELSFRLTAVWFHKKDRQRLCE